MVTVYSCAPVAPPSPHPARLPSVCEINLVFVPVGEASVVPCDTFHRGGVGPVPSLQPLVTYLHSISALHSAGSWVGVRVPRVWLECWLVPLC